MTPLALFTLASVLGFAAALLASHGRMAMQPRQERWAITCVLMNFVLSFLLAVAVLVAR